MKKNEFIKGKWYRSNDWCPKNYVKGDYTRIYFTEWINTQGQWLEMKDWFDNSSLYEVPIEEIQQFLPENHPDKIVKIPKSWYIIITKENLEVLSKWRFEQSYPIYKLEIGEITGMYNESSKEHNSIHSTDGFGKEITFEFFKTYIMNKQEEYKYTPEYCKQEKNKVAIHVITGKEVEECDKLLFPFIGGGHKYFYNDSILRDECISAFESTHCRPSYYVDKGYDIIEAKDFIKHNTKTIKYTKQDWIDGKCAIRWEDNKSEEINNFIKCCNIDNTHINGLYKYYYSKGSGIYHCTDNINLPIVTIDELLNDKDMKKIIGYKVPFDITSCGYLKGEILTLSDNKDFYSLNKSGRTIGKEIVEQWEPVYEDEFKVGDWIVPLKDCDKNTYHTRRSNRPYQIYDILSNGIIVVYNENGKVDGNGKMKFSEARLATPEEIKATQSKTITVGDKRILFTISKGKIEADGTTFSIEEWKELALHMKNVRNIKRYTVTLSSVKVGCTNISMDEIELIINTYNQING